MKKYYFYFLYFLLSISCYSQSPQKIPTITINLKNPDDGKYIKLRCSDYKDSVQMKRNQETYVLKGTISEENEEALYDLFIGKDFMQFFLYDEDISIKWDLHNSIKEAKFKNYVDSISGSPTSTECLNKFIFIADNYFLKIKYLQDSLLTIYDIAKSNEINRQIDSINLQAELFITKDIFKVNRITVLKNYVYTITSSIRMQRYEWVVDSISKKYPNSPSITRAVKNYRYYLSYYKTSETSSIKPTSFALPDNNNQLVNLLFPDQKNYVILDFWASWCAPCREAIPQMKKIYTSFKSKNIKFVTISVDKKKEDWLKALEKEQMSEFINLWDVEHKVAEKYKIKFVPSTFLISPEGKVIESNLTPWQWSNLLNKIFSSK